MKRYLEEREKIEKIRSSMFVKEKRDGNGIFEKLKGRLVADGSQQDRTLYGNFQSQPAYLDAIILELTGAAIKKSKWSKVDIGGAYLNALLNDEDIIVMTLRKHVSNILCDRFKSMRKYRNKSGNILVQIIKAMCELVQSAALSFEALTLYLRKLCFKHNSHDQCVMTRKTKSSSIVLIIYVDDILVLGDDDDEITYLLGQLEKEYNTIVFER